jgi:hypothetical protein
MIIRYTHKVLTDIEYRAVSGVFQTIDPPSTLHPPGGEGVGGQYFGRRQTLDWPLTAQYLYGYTVTVQDRGDKL